MFRLAGPTTLMFGKVPLIVVHLLEAVVLQVLKDLTKAALGLAEKHGICMHLRFLGMQHGADAAEDDRDAPCAKPVGDLPSPLDLARQHARDGDKVHLLVEIDAPPHVRR